MKRALVYLLIGLGSFIIIVFALSNIEINNRPVWGYLNKNIVVKGGQTYQMFQDIENCSKKNLFVLGSSHAYRGYDPRIFAKNDFQLCNMGTSGQSIRESYLLLRKYRNRIKYLIVDIYPAVMQSINDESPLLIIQNSNEFDIAWSVSKTCIDINTINNFLYRCFRMDDKPKYLEEGYVGAGYVESNEVFKPHLYNTPAIDQFNANMECEKYLDKLLEIISLNKIQAVFVNNPVPVNEFNQSLNKQFGEYIINKLSSHSIPFFDYSVSHDMDSTYFKDYNHMNQKGVSWFNQIFLDKIAEHNLFK